MNYREPSIPDWSAFSAYLIRQRRFSLRTFGPGLRTGGVLGHIRKEVAEVEQAVANGRPTLPEWVDLIILSLDGALRSGADPDEIIDAMIDKLGCNERRLWPDWREGSPDEPIEHVRTGDPS